MKFDQNHMIVILTPADDNTMHGDRQDDSWYFVH